MVALSNARAYARAMPEHAVKHCPSTCPGNALRHRLYDKKRTVAEDGNLNLFFHS
jgi:hypothetical protein